MARTHRDGPVKKRAVDAECIKAATAANAREAPGVSSGNRRRPPFQPISSERKLELLEHLQEQYFLLGTF